MWCREERSARRALACVVLSAVFLTGGALDAGSSDCVFIRGDIRTDNGPGVVDLNDGVEILAYLFLGRSPPACQAAADVNDNGLVELSDYTYLVNHLFNDGPPPPPPFPDAGTDPTPGISVPDEPDERFRFSFLGGGTGVPSMSGIQIPVALSNSEGVSGLQMVMRYNTRDPECPDLLINEIRTEEGTLLSQESADYIIAEFDNFEGVAYVSALKDFATPFWFQVGEDPNFPAGEDQLVATIVLTIAACANRGVTEIEFADGVAIPPPNGLPPPPDPRPEAHNLVMIDAQAVRPVLGESAAIEVVPGFVRGDSNKDDRVDLSDGVFNLMWIFRGGREPPCRDAADVNNDTRVDISDSIFLFSYLFRGGPQPSEPFPQAGLDPSDDGRGSLGCESDG